MVNKTKLGLVGLALTTAMGCSSIKPHGHIDVGYVPLRVDDQIVENQIKTEVDTNLQFELKKGLDLIVGGTSRTFMDLPSDTWAFAPTRQEWDTYIRMLFGENFEVYAFHNCSHPMLKGGQEGWVTADDDKRYYVNHDDTTEIGVKYKW